MTDGAESYTLRELKFLAGGNIPQQINIERMFATSFEDQQRLIEKSLNWCVNQLVANRHLKQDHSEDELTIDVMLMLKGLGYDATHDTQIGGHCDILVQGSNDFMWICESKLHGAYDWLLKGYEQLDSRYSTGQAGQDSGAILIFSRNAHVDKLMANWREHLAKKRPDVEFEDISDDANGFYSTHKHKGTGRTFKVRHKPVNLYWKPTDPDVGKPD